MSNSEDEYWKPREQKRKTPAVQTPKRNEVNRPAEAVAQSSIASALNYSKGSSVSSSASTSTPTSASHAGPSRQVDNIYPVKGLSMASPATTPTTRDKLTSLYNKIKVSSQPRAGPSSAEGRKSDQPPKITKNNTPNNVMNTPSKFRSNVVVIVDDSDSDEVMEVPTDTESSQPRQRTGQGIYPLTAESSQSSMDSTASMFASKLRVSSSTSSIESIEPIPAVTKASTSTPTSGSHPAPPVKVNDVFSSPNVTLRRQTPKRGTKASSTATTVATTIQATPLQIIDVDAEPPTVVPYIALAPSAPIPEAYVPKPYVPEPYVPEPYVLEPYVPQPYVPEPNKKVPDSIIAFSKSAIGTGLDLNVIAHSDEVQALFDRYRIAWGTQYELSRGVIAGVWTWEDVKLKMQKLKGTNADIAGRVKAIMRGQDSTPPANLNLWKEMDREQMSIEENEHRGLGLWGDFEGATDWYGGQIQQLGRLVKTESGYFRIVLEEQEKRRSHRFARYYGSRRFLQIKIPTALLQQNADENGSEEVKKFLTKKFVLCGRVYIPFHSREEGLYMVETNEDHNRSGALWGGDAFRMSFNEFINWHNPIEKNYDQAISKYATRFALGLSNSVPALEFEEENILFIDDITTPDWPKGKPNPPADKLMTDGCGFMNLAALQKIVRYLGLESVPAGVQGRIDGSKGFWIMHPHDKSPSPKIWIRTSQHKIKNRSFDRAHMIFDHLGPSKPTPSSAITAQSIINLHSNNIPQELLVKMMEDGLESEITPFLEWDIPDAMLFLAQTINKNGSVVSARTQRLAASLNRALGLRGRDWGAQHVEMEEQEELADDDMIALTGRNKYSGGAASFHEMAYEMVQAGFHPRHSRYLADKIKRIIESTIKSTVEKYRISVDESLGAYVVPDPLGVLGEGEIYYHFSVARKDPRTDMLVHNLEGDVVLGRYPIRLPSDMQKVKAVVHNELEKWPDVVIVSTKGKRSLASLLADGDMDGDELIAIWDPEIVQYFQNKPFTNPPPDLMEKNFDRDVVRVEEFCTKTLHMTQKDASMAFQSVLLANLSQNKVGLYSKMHDNAVIKYGYGHKNAIRLAYIFNTLLDASKSGRRLKAGIFEDDQNKYLRGNLLTQPQHRDILRVLLDAGNRKGEDLLARYNNAAPDPMVSMSDSQLRQPYDAEVDYALAVHKVAPMFHEDLVLIRKHVDIAHQMWKEACNKDQMKKATSIQSPTKKGAQSQKRAARKDIMLAATRAYAAPIAGVKMVRQVEQVKASFAYQLSENFAFSMAFQELCHIKAMASPGGVVASLRIFDEARTFASTFMRTLTRREEDYY